MMRLFDKRETIETLVIGLNPVTGMARPSGCLTRFIFISELAIWPASCAIASRSFTERK